MSESSTKCEGCGENFFEDEKVYVMIFSQETFCAICYDSMDRPHLFEDYLAAREEQGDE